MRDLFGEYYQPSNEEFAHLWREATFVFDTNVLLNLYRYTASTRDDLLRILEQLQERIWLPHQVGLEFSRNRTSVIGDQNQIFHLIDAFNTFVEEKFTKAIVQKYRRRGHFFADLDKIQAIFEQTKQALQDELQHTRARHPDPMDQDPFIERLDNIVRGKIGHPYSNEDMVQLSAQFEERYKQNLPPGFKDAAKKQIYQDDDPSNPANKYGDVIIWYQIIAYAKQEKHPIIFVVDDVKEDWWQIIHGEKRGPRIELRREMQQKAGVLFYTYTADNFLQKAHDFLQLQAQKETITEIQEKRQGDRRSRDLQLALLPSPDLYPSPALFPSLSVSRELLQQLGAAQELINAFGGIERLQQDIRQQQEFIRMMRPFLPPGTVFKGRENLEDTQGPEDADFESGSRRFFLGRCL